MRNAFNLHIKLFLSLWWMLPMFIGGVAYGQQSICVGTTTQYRVDMNENNGQGSTGSTYEWNVLSSNFNGFIIPITSSGNQIEIDWHTTPPGTYVLQVTETNEGLCTSEQSLTIFLRATPFVNLNDRLVCIDRDTGQWIDNVVFTTGYNTAQFSFQWFQDGNLISHTGSSLTVQQPGVYTVIVTNIATGCSETSTATVTVVQPLVATGTIGNAFDLVQSINIQVTGGVGPFEYSLNGGGFQSGNTFSVSEPGLQIVQVRDMNGCEDIQIVELFAVNYPRFFTPNGDGYNDFWTISGLPNAEANLITIFDRFSKVLYQFRPGQQGWDGTYNGREMPSTDYWFVLEYLDQNGVKREFKSHFALKR